MNALCFKAMSTAKNMINDLGDEVEKDKDVYWTISGTECMMKLPNLT